MRILDYLNYNPTLWLVGVMAMLPCYWTLSVTYSWGGISKTLMSSEIEVLLKFQHCIKIVSLNVWVRYFVWNFKVPCEIPHKISYPYNKKMYISYTDGNLRALWFKSSYTLKCPPGPCLNIKTIFPDIRVPIIKMRWPSHCLTFLMGIFILVRWHIYIEMTPDLPSDMQTVSFWSVVVISLVLEDLWDILTHIPP